MIFECKLKEFLTYRHTTIMLLKISERDGYMVTYKENLLEEPYITVYKVLGGKMTIEEGIDYSGERRWQAEPQGVLVINCVGHRLYLTKSGERFYELANSCYQNYEDDFSNFTPINEINLECLKQVYPIIKLRNIKLFFLWDKISEVISDKISFEAITYLSLNDCNLSAIPKEIRLFKNLRSLWVSNNQIVDVDEDLFNCDSGLIGTLKQLNLDENQIKKLPLNIFNLKNLKKLYLSSNKLKYLSDRIEDLSKLRKLLLCNNRLRSLPASILKLSNLKQCVTDRNPFYNLDNQIIHIVSKNQDIPKLSDMGINAVYKKTLLSGKIPVAFHLFRRYEERKTCLCGNKVFEESRKAFLKITRATFIPKSFPIELICCSKRCFVQQISKITENN